MGNLFLYPPLIGICAHAPRAGKTTAAEALLGFGSNWVRLPLAKPIKEITIDLLLQLGLDLSRATRYVYDAKEEVIPELGVTSRHMQRTLGTEWGRQQVNPRIWLDCWLQEYRRAALGGLPVVVDDVRFPDEADLIKAQGGELWLIEHPTGDIQQGVHASEGGLVGYRGFDLKISNRGTIDELRQIVQAEGRRRFSAWVAPTGRAPASRSVLDEPLPALRPAIRRLLQPLRRLRRSRSAHAPGHH